MHNMKNKTPSFISISLLVLRLFCKLCCVSKQGSANGARVTCQWTLIYNFNTPLPSPPTKSPPTRPAHLHAVSVFLVRQYWLPVACKTIVFKTTTENTIYCTFGSNVGNRWNHKATLLSSVGLFVNCMWTLNTVAKDQYPCIQYMLAMGSYN